METSYTLSNPFEAQLVAAIISLYRIAQGPAEPTQEDFWRYDAGVVTPHRAQVATIRNLLQVTGNLFRDAVPVVDTVDRFQGQERKLIVSSYAVADRDFTRSEEKFILDPRRFNVTLTRAKSKFVMVISDALVQHLAADADVARNAAHLQLFVEEYCDSLDRELNVPYVDNGQMRIMECRLRGKRAP